MESKVIVERLIRSSIQRAIQETIAAVVVIAVFTLILLNCPVGSLPFFGCLLMLLATAFIVGVVWSYALSYRLLSSHPASDTAFWRGAFRSQARLLRLVPLWYLAPMGAGGLILISPTDPTEWPAFGLASLVILIIFAGVTYINFRCASYVDMQLTKLIAINGELTTGENT